MSLLNTLSQEFRSDYTNRFDKNELRPSRVGCLNFFMEERAQRPIFDPETLANIMRSFGNTVEVPVLDAQSVTVTTPFTRSCSVVDSENDSAIVVLTFAAFGWAFSMTNATHYNNDVKMQTDFNRKFEKFRLEFENLLDTTCIAQLETDKNQFFTGIVPDFYAEVGDALQIPQAEKNDFYNNLEAIFTTMDFNNNISVVAATSHMPLVRRLDAQGDSNATNEGFQLSLNGYRWFPTNRLVNGVGVESTGFAVENGNAFIGNRNDADTAVGYSINGGSKVWATETIPLGTGSMEMGTFFQEDCGDRNAIGGAATAGNTRSLFSGFEFSTDVIFATSYQSAIATRFQPIQKFEVLS